MILQYSVLFLVFNYLLQINFNILSGIGQVHKKLKISSACTLAVVFAVMVVSVLILRSNSEQLGM